MASILKIPSETSKGVLVFTTVERDLVLRKNSAVLKRIERLKSKWVIVLHPNYFDHDFKLDPIFDVTFNCVDLLTSSTPFSQLSVQVHSFTPSFFKPSKQDKFWDILHVSRAQTSKNIPEFFEIIRKLYDQGKMYRVLLICTIPDKNWLRGDIVSNIRDYYDELFTEPEKDLFTLLTTSYRQPYPFDTKTISHFYNSSKILLNTGGGERQGRINAYAWCTGMPLVSLDRMKDLIPQHLRKEPIFYPGKTYDDLPEQVIKAIEYSDTEHNLDDFEEMYHHCSETFNERTLKKELAKFYSVDNTVANDSLFNVTNLDRRVARHCGFGDTTTSIDVPLSSVIDYLETATNTELSALITNDDPETQLFESGFLKRGKNPEFTGIKYTVKSFVMSVAIKIYKKYIKRK
jgi:glycosyltransferase involved in cell wall biosynthesis